MRLYHDGQSEANKGCHRIDKHIKKCIIPQRSFSWFFHINFTEVSVRTSSRPSDRPPDRQNRLLLALYRQGQPMFALPLAREAEVSLGYLVSDLDDMTTTGLISRGLEPSLQRQVYQIETPGVERLIRAKLIKLPPP